MQLIGQQVVKGTENGLTIAENVDSIHKQMVIICRSDM